MLFELVRPCMPNTNFRGVLPENGNLITKKLSTKKKQYDFYYEVFSKLSETPALKGYIESVGYNLLDNILDSKGNPLFDFKFSDISFIPFTGKNHN